MAPPQILEAEHACGVSHVHGAATRARLHTVKYAICFSVAAQCACVSLTSKYLPCINVAGMREAKKAHDRVFFYYPSRARASLDISLSRVTLCV